MTDRITVRTYGEGFGDCCLIGLWAGGTPAWMLIGCGSLTASEGKLAEIVSDIVSTCTPAGGGRPRIELVVGTHRQRDHVAGFGDPRWADVDVGEVWLPWTEDPDCEPAVRIRERQAALAATLVASSAAETSGPSGTDLDSRSASARELEAVALNALAHEAAMAMLHSGFSGAPPRRFLPGPEAATETRTPAGFPGVSLHVLGPPRLAQTRAIMDPPSGPAYLRWPRRIPPRMTSKLFAERWRIDDAGFRAGHPDSTFSDEDRADISAAIDEPIRVLGATIDRAVSNTSLVLVLEIGRHLILFPAVAQWGAWNAILENSRARGLLAKATACQVSRRDLTPPELLTRIAPLAVDILRSPATTTAQGAPDPARAPAARKTGARRTTPSAKAALRAGARTERPLYVEWDQAVA